MTTIWSHKLPLSKEDQETLNFINRIIYIFPERKPPVPISKEAFLRQLMEEMRCWQFRDSKL